jgi:hypothetical protein
MPDLTALASWVQAHHWQGHALQAYRQALASHPARLLVLRRFLLDGVADRLNRFLAGEVEFQTVYGLYSAKDGYVTADEWLQAETDDHLLKFGELSGPRPGFQLSPNLLTYLRFRKAFCDPAFTAFFQEISGQSLGSSTFSAHAMKVGDFIHEHDDAVQNRRLAYVLYMSSRWQPRFGGALRMIALDGQVFDIEAEYNSLVIFDVTAETRHYVAPIAVEAGETIRVSLGGWFREQA